MMEQITDKESPVFERTYAMVNAARHLRQQLSNWEEKLETTGATSPNEYDSIQIDKMVNEKVQQQVDAKRERIRSEFEKRTPKPTRVHKVLVE